MTLLRDLDITGLDPNETNTKYALETCATYDAHAGKRVHVDAQDCCLSVDFEAVFVGCDVEIHEYDHRAPRQGLFLRVRGFAFDNGVIATGDEIESAIRGDDDDEVPEGVAALVDGSTVSVSTFKVVLMDHRDDDGV